MDSKVTTTLKVKKGIENIDKIIHVSSVLGVTSTYK